VLLYLYVYNSKTGEVMPDSGLNNNVHSALKQVKSCPTLLLMMLLNVEFLIFRVDLCKIRELLQSLIYIFFKK
jgi:hypothetical protein